jgi:putative FmdB family regulatory protein
MPLYEYTCRKCEHTFEALVSGRTATVVKCPKCESEELDRLIGLPAPGRVQERAPATNCRGDGPPCGAPWCGRKRA